LQNPIAGDLFLGTTPFNSQAHSTTSFTLPMSLLRDGDNSITLQALNGPSDFSLLVALILRSIFAVRTLPAGKRKNTLAVGLSSRNRVSFTGYFTALPACHHHRRFACTGWGTCELAERV